MLLQWDITGYEWVIGVGLMFGLAFIFTWLIKKDVKVFFIWLVIFNGFLVWGDMLELWTLVLSMIVLVAVLFIQIRGNLSKGGDEE